MSNPANAGLEPTELTTIAEQLRAIMSVPVELVGNVLAIGNIRNDQLAEMTVILSEDVPDTLELRSANPRGPQRNTTDRSAMLDLALGEELPYAIRAYYLRYVRPDMALKRLITIEGSRAQALIEDARKTPHQFAAVIRHRLIGQLPGESYAEAYDLVDIGVLSRAPHVLYATILPGINYWVHVNREVPLCTLYGPVGTNPATTTESKGRAHG